MNSSSDPFGERGVGAAIGDSPALTYIARGIRCGPVFDAIGLGIGGLWLIAHAACVRQQYEYKSNESFGYLV